jgi:hypothetical protein
MDSIPVLREQLVSSHWLLEACLEGMTTEQLWWMPPGTANSVADNYLHVVLNEDDIVQGLLRNLLSQNPRGGRRQGSLRCWGCMVQGYTALRNGRGGSIR